VTFTDQPLLDALLRGVILAMLGLVWVVLLVRANGLRSFSKMTNFDFVTTIATGSLLAGASQATGWPSFVQPLAAILGLFVLQRVVAHLRNASRAFESVIQNEPVMLMRDGEMLDGALAKTRVARDDVTAKLREANVLDLSEVRAVVLETTGDISVLHGEECASDLLDGVGRP